MALGGNSSCGGAAVFPCHPRCCLSAATSFCEAGPSAASRFLHVSKDKEGLGSAGCKGPAGWFMFARVPRVATVPARRWSVCHVSTLAPLRSMKRSCVPSTWIPSWYGICFARCSACFDMAALHGVLLLDHRSAYARRGDPKIRRGPSTGIAGTARFPLFP